METRVQPHWKTLVCKRVPDEHNTNQRLKEHFAQFGDVGKVVTNPSREQATVFFRDHESAANAIKDGSIVDYNYPPMIIFWRKTPTSKGDTTHNTAMALNSQSLSSLNATKQELESELAALQGTGDYDTGSISIPSRPKGLVSDGGDTQEILPRTRRRSLSRYAPNEQRISRMSSREGKSPGMVGRSRFTRTMSSGAQKASAMSTNKYKLNRRGVGIRGGLARGGKRPHDESTQQSKPAVLFGKTTNRTAEPTQQSLFGKPTNIAVAAKQKPGQQSEPKVLFGKPTNTASGTLFGKSVPSSKDVPPKGEHFEQPNIFGAFQKSADDTAKSDVFGGNIKKNTDENTQKAKPSGGFLFPIMGEGAKSEKASIFGGPQKQATGASSQASNVLGGFQKDTVESEKSSFFGGFQKKVESESSGNTNLFGRFQKKVESESSGNTNTFGSFLKASQAQKKEDDTGKLFVGSQKDDIRDSPNIFGGFKKSVFPSKSEHEKGFSGNKEQQTFKPPVQTTSRASPVPSSHVSSRTYQGAGDRYDCLDEQDKLIRENLNKRSTESKMNQKAVVGTCPDMCPEKERYMREHRRRLHNFEISTSADSTRQNPKVDHIRAVKEYSRSSADQDQPLPHELRPTHVLVRTMDYLVNNILDRGGDGSWGDWYDFLWDRTRGIRKDITQQNICDREVVSLVERCVRFHIYSSERLCEEGAMVFDVKINNENLTKCLQTLTEMYHDLDVRKVSCPNEAEFRAYMVLMNLNEGDTLRKCQSLKREILESPAITFVLKVYSALNANNYVKFFKLVKAAPFMYACIMHRYFNQIRLRAIITMCKVYTPGRPIPYPIHLVTRQLSFENDAQTTEFLQYHGLNVTSDQVMLDRRGFMEPELAYPLKRAPLLVESKLATSVGEAVNGAPLPRNELSTPHSSFDTEGHYCPSEDISVMRRVSPVPTQEPAPPQEESKEAQSTPPSAGVNNEVLKMLAKDLLLEVTDEVVEETSHKMLVFLKMAVQLNDQVFTEVLSPLLREACQSAIGEVTSEKKEEEERNKLEQEMRKKAEIAQIKEQTAHSLIETLTGEICQEMAQDQIKEVRGQLKQESMMRMSEVVARELLQETVMKTSISYAESFFQNDVVDRVQLLDECEKAVILLKQQRFFKNWKNAYLGRNRLRRNMLAFPPNPCLGLPQDQVNVLLPSGSGLQPTNSISLGSETRLTLSAPSEVSRQELKLSLNVALHNLKRDLNQKRAWAPINIVDLIASCPRKEKILERTRDGRLPWKLILALGDDDTKCKRWLKSKLKRGAVPNSQYKSQVLSLYSHPCHDVTVSICVRTCEEHDEDLSLVKEKRLFQGSSAILFQVDQPDYSDNESFWHMTQARLETVIKSKPISPAVPLCVLVHGWMDMEEEEIEEMLKLEELLDEGLISEYNLTRLEQDVEHPDSCEELEDCVRWLIHRYPQLPEVNIEPLSEFVETQLQKHFFTTVYQDLKERRKNGLLDPNPESLVSLYNSVVDHLINVTREECQVSWPMPEFFLHEEDLIPSNPSEIKRHLETLKLPKFVFSDLSDDDWQTLCVDLKAYLHQFTLHDVQTVDLVSKVRKLVRRCSSDVSLLSYQAQPFYINMAWADFVTACVDHQLKRLAEKTSKSEGDRGVVIKYTPDSIEEFHPPKLWRETVKQQSVADSMTLDTTVRSSVKRRRMPVTPQLAKIPKTLLETPESQKIKRSLAFVPRSLDESVAMETAGSLEVALKTEKKQQKIFEDYLSKALQNGSNTVSEKMDLTPDGLKSSSFSALSRDLFTLKKELEIERKAEKLHFLRLESSLLEVPVEHTQEYHEFSSIQNLSY